MFVLRPLEYFWTLLLKDTSSSSFFPQPLGYFRWRGCQCLLPGVWGTGYLCGALQQSQPQVKQPWHRFEWISSRSWTRHLGHILLNVLMWSCNVSMSCLMSMISSYRVKEIAVGIMANMLCHEKVFLGILDKQRYLEKLLRVLDVKDSPTLSLVFRWTFALVFLCLCICLQHIPLW